MKKSLCPKKNEQISHQNEHRNYCSLSVPVILSSPKKEKKRRSYVLPEHIIISTLKTIPQKKQNRIKTSIQQYVRSCTTTVYVNLSMNTFKKIAPENNFCSQKRMQNYSFSPLQPNILIENIIFFLYFNILLQIKQGFISLYLIIYKHNIRTYLLNYDLPIRKKLSFKGLVLIRFSYNSTPPTMP